MSNSFRIAFVLLGFSSGAFGQQKACDLIPDYAMHEAELHRKYLENIRVVTVEKGYDKITRTGKLEGTATRTSIFGKRNMRLNTVVRRVDETADLISGAMYNFDELCTLAKEGDKFVIEDRYFHREHISRIESDLCRIGPFLPLTLNGWMRFRAIDDLNAYFKALGNVPPYKFLSSKKTTYGGREPIVISFETQSGEVSENYYDPSNSYALLGHDSGVGWPGPNAKKLVGKITYEPSDLGYPVPKKYVAHFVEPDGKFIPYVEVDFLKWERYSPAPDDFDMEKHFGVKPLPRPVKAPSPLIDSISEAPERNWGL